MQATVLYGPRDVRFEELEDPKIVEPTDVILRHPGNVRLRVGPVAVPGLAAHQGADADGTRVLRLCRRGRPCGQVCETGAICDRLVRHIGQHLS